MQWHMPLGYKVVDGKITICEEQRKIVNRYLQTMTAEWRQAGSPRT